VAVVVAAAVEAVVVLSSLPLGLAKAVAAATPPIAASVPRAAKRFE
jgi:hypothetical protein